MKTADRLGGVKTLKVTGFLDEFEKDDVKRNVDIVTLFESFGVKLARQGKSYMGLCPFHDDKNPSLSVDREKGLYNCFGCGEGGDAFDLVMKLKGIGFREALDYLKRTDLGKTLTSPKHNPADVEHPQGVRAEEKPSKQEQLKRPTEAESTVSLDEVTEYYTKSLAESKEAAAYLESRGLWKPEILKRLKVGYCKGYLRSKVSDSGFEAFKEIGIFTEKGSEAFKGCVTIPLFGEDGKIYGLYGRRTTNRNPAHLYLKGPHRGLVNRKAASVYPERIIITESVIDALSLLVLGIENVIPAYGSNGFTDEHLKLLKDKRVKELCIAFDSDDAGRKASAKLNERLLTEGFLVRELFPEKGKDWNEALLAGMSRDVFNTLIDNSNLYSSDGRQYKTKLQKPSSP